MNNQQALTRREILFCGYCARLGDPFQAARRAGWKKKQSGNAAVRLLAREEIRREIRRLREEESDALAALRRVALGGVNDAVLLAGEEPLSPEEVAALDLSALAELKRQKGGGWEMKFHDRIRALELLLEHEAQRDRDGSRTLLEALEKGAEALAGREAGSNGGD